MKKLNAGILIIGDEVLSGRTKDTNSNFIAKKLIESGIQLDEIISSIIIVPPTRETK